MIIVEGFDASGKTTLVRAVADALGWPAYKIGTTPGSVAEVERYIAQCNARMREACVQDRVTHISEGIYSFLRDGERSGAALAHLPDLRETPVILIYCRPPDAVLLQGLERHEDKPYDTEDHMAYVRRWAPHLINMYDGIIGLVESDIPVVRYDYTVANAMETVVTLLKERFR